MSTLRRRNVTVEKVDNDFPRDEKKSRIASMDMFLKPKEEFSRTQTLFGGIISNLVVGIVILLLLSEIYDYALGNSAYRTELSIAGDNSGYMTLSIDIDFPSMRCNEIRVDLADVTGAFRRNVTHSVHKIPLDNYGKEVFHGTNFYDLFTGQRDYNPRMDPESSEYCGSCALAKDMHKMSSSTKCCNTCESVDEYYRSFGVSSPDKSLVQQCLEEISRENPGCKIKGSLSLRKVRGALIFAPKLSSKTGSYNIVDILRFSSSHVIHSFSFGEPLNSFSHFRYHSLDGVRFERNEIVEVKYLLNLISSKYIRRLNERKITKESFEYSRQAHYTNIRYDMGIVPSVSFQFNIFPIQIIHIFQREPFVHFLVRLCSIIGGVFVIAGVFDDIVHAIESKSKRNNGQLRKMTIL